MRTLFTCILISGCSSLLAQSYTLDNDLSTIAFAIRNFGVTVKGEFQDAGGELVLNEEDPTTSSFKAYVQAASIATGIGLRDKHLREDAYLDVKHFQKITITSRQVSRENNKWSATVWVTIKDVTRDLSIDFELDKKERGCTFTSTFKLNRLDFNVGANSFTLADDVIVTLKVVGVEKPRLP
ncbi:MAG TPA: YceI family protein [Chryseosolibacter sp.]